MIYALPRVPSYQGTGINKGKSGKLLKRKISERNLGIPPGRLKL
jgi:hypothetical protein